MSDTTVLVTGGTGFVARWCIVELLRRGHAVRTTVRSARAEDRVRAAVAAAVDAGDRLAFVPADLGADDGWSDAVAGCAGVLHVASPMGPDDPEGQVTAARDGARRVVEAAVAADVRRIVMTSAANTSSPPSYADDGVTDETLWTDAADPDLPPYRRSKVEAERAAWEAVADDPTRLATVLPGAVFGPVLGTDNLGSTQIIRRMLAGEMPGTPRIGLEVVDVRDVVDAHLRALDAEAAGGERFLATGDFLWMGDIARILRNGLGEAARAVPTEEIADDVVRAFAEHDAGLASIVPGLGRRHRHTTAKADATLGWSRRPVEDTILDCARSLIDQGAI